MIFDANGNRYTSVNEDMQLKRLHKAFLQTLHREITIAMQNARGPQMALNPAPLIEFIDQAYYAGKDAK